MNSLVEWLVVMYPVILGVAQVAKNSNAIPLPKNYAGLFAAVVAFAYGLVQAFVQLHNPVWPVVITVLILYSFSTVGGFELIFKNKADTVSIIRALLSLFSPKPIVESVLPPPAPPARPLNTVSPINSSGNHIANTLEKPEGSFNVEPVKPPPPTQP